MIFKYVDFLILEKNNLVSKYVEKHNISKEDLDKIRGLLKSNPSLLFNFLNYHIEDEMPITNDGIDKDYQESPFGSLENFIKYIQNNKQKLKNFLPKDLIQYTIFEELYDDINTVELKARIKKDFVDKLPSKLRKQFKVKDYTEENIKIIQDWARQDRELYTPAVKFHNLNDYMKHLKDTTDDLSNDIDKSKIAELKKWDGKDDIELIYDENDVLVFRVISPIFIKKYGSQRWCIVNDMGKYFKDYIDPREGNTQYLIFNFNYGINDKFHKFGVTLDKDGNTLDGASQDATNKPHDLSKIIEINGLPDDLIVSFEYSDTVIDKFEEIFKYTKGYVTLTNDVFLKHKEYYILDGDIFAQSFNSISLFKLFLEYGVDPNITYSDYDVPIVKLTSNGDYNKVKLLIDNGADVNKVNVGVSTLDEKNSALMEASKNSNYDIFKLLLDNGADVNYKNKSNETAITKASRGDNYEIFKTLVDKSDDINIQNKSGWNPLLMSVRHTKLPYIKLLLEQPNINTKCTANGLDAIGVLSILYNEKSASVLKLLIKNGFDINTIDDDSYGYNILMNLITNKNAFRLKDLRQLDTENNDIEKEARYDMINILLDNNIDLLAIDRLGNSAISLAVNDDDSEIVDILLRKDIDLINSTTKHDNSILQKAINENYIDTIDVILKHAKENKSALDINHKNNQDDTALFNALEQPDIMSELIKLGAKVNIVGDDGYTPLLFSIKFRYIDAVRTLLDNGADVNKVSNSNDSALLLSYYISKVNIFSIIVNHYISNNIKPKDNILKRVKATINNDKETNGKNEKITILNKLIRHFNI